MRIQLKFFHKIVKKLHFDPLPPNFDLFASLKWPKNKATEAHILRTSKRNSKDYVRQDCFESGGNFFTK